MCVVELLFVYYDHHSGAGVVVFLIVKVAGGREEAQGRVGLNGLQGVSVAEESEVELVERFVALADGDVGEYAGFCVDVAYVFARGECVAEASCEDAAVGFGNEHDGV